MKITSRRFGRSTASEDVDEGMGGGDYPTIVSDLSVASDLQVIPEQTYPELPAAPAPDGYGPDDDFWGSVGSDPDKSRRWFRSRADKRPLTEADDYPVVDPAGVSGLSVEPDLHVIPDADGAQPTLTEEPPNYGDGGNFWTSVGTEPEKAPRPWWRRRTTYIVATILVTVIALVVSLIAFSGPQVKNKRIAYTFPVEAFPQTGVTVSRTWTLYGGQHPSLHADLTFYSSRSDQVTVEELLPTSLVTKASQVTFIPKPKIVSEDPVVASYSISSALDGVTSAQYTIPLPVNTPYNIAVLHEWAAQQAAESGQRYLRSHTLRSIALTPPSIVVKKGGPAYQLAISGLQQDGNAAPTIAFGTAKWSVANPKIARVNGKGQVTGLTPGKTTVTATIGKLSAKATVTVSAAPNVKATPPLKPLKPGPLLSLTPESFPSSIGVLPTPSFIDPVTHKPITVTHKPPVTKPPVVNPPPVNPPPVVCPTAPPAPAEVTAFATSDTSIAVSWAAPSVPAGCGFTLTGYSVTGTDGAGTPLGAIVAVGGSSAAFSNLAAGTASVSVVASYGAVNSAAVGASAAVNGAPAPPPPPPPPPPVCDPATQDFGPTGLAAAADPANPDTFTVSWTPASAAAGSPCSVTGEVATLDGTTVTNGATLPLAPGPHTLVVTATFADGTIAAPQISFDAP